MITETEGRDVREEVSCQKLRVYPGNVSNYLSDKELRTRTIHQVRLERQDTRGVWFGTTRRLDGPRKYGDTKSV